MPRSKTDIARAKLRAKLSGMSGFERFCFERIKLTQGFTQPTRMALLDWQRAFFVPLAHAKRSDGSQRYDQAFLAMARGGSKTTSMAAFALYHLMTHQGDPEVLTAATNRDQASLTLRAAQRMIEADKYLDQHVRVMSHEIRYKGGVMKAVRIVNSSSVFCTSDK